MPKTSPEQPFMGLVVRLIDSGSWRDDPLPRLLRRYGAKVVYRDTRTTTHIVTCFPASAEDAVNSWMSSGVRAEYRAAVRCVEGAGRTPVCWSYAQVSDVFDAMHATRHEAKESRRAAALEPLVGQGTGEMPGFVGI